MTKFTVIVLSAARQDLLGCVEYLQADDYPSSAARLVRTFEDTVKSLQYFPECGSKHTSRKLGWEIRWMPLKKKSVYRLYYRIEGTTVTVFHVRVGQRPVDF